MELDDFLRDRNIARYRKLLESSANEPERRTILNLMAEEVAKLRRTHQQSKCGEPVGRAHRRQPQRLSREGNSGSNKN
jgi:hypothetical protein